jgi:hypothetical protein
MILPGYPEDIQVEFTLIFHSQQLLTNFAHDINEMEGLIDSYNLFHEETDKDVAPPKTPSHVIDLTVSPPTNAAEDNKRATLDNLDLSSKIYQMAIETPIKRIIQLSPFSKGTKSNTSPSQ